ncbi:MAG: hypothetical protein JST67_04535 [Bacteroidetes bacterium]|nr:hypothetical protein [Bacteroidota bacterium]
MKKTKAIFFLFLFATSLFLLYLFFDFGIKHNLNIKTSYITARQIKADVLILGPCEPLWMVAPDIITKNTQLSCYNLAESHSDFADNYLHLYLYLYLKNNAAPKYLLLFVTPESFDTNYNTFYSYRFSAFLEDTVVANTVRQCDNPFYNYQFIPLMRYVYYNHQTFFKALQGWKHYVTKKQKPYYPDGFEPPAKMVWDNHYEQLKKKYPQGYYFNWSPLRSEYLNKILYLCKEKNIRVLLYESPILQETAQKQPNRVSCIDSIKKIAEHAQVPFVSFQDMPLAMDKKNYISPMVTTLRGSYLFSDTLSRFFYRWIKK